MSEAKASIADLRKKKVTELDQLLVSFRNQLRETRFDVQANQLSKVHRVNELKKSIAKVMTIKHERALKNQKQ